VGKVVKMKFEEFQYAVLILVTVPTVVGFFIGGVDGAIIGFICGAVAGAYLCTIVDLED